MQWSPLILHQEVEEDEVDDVDQRAVALDAPQKARHTRAGDTDAGVVSEAWSSNPPCARRTGTEKLRNNSTERKMSHTATEGEFSFLYARKMEDEHQESLVTSAITMGVTSNLSHNYDRYKFVHQLHLVYYFYCILHLI